MRRENIERYHYFTSGREGKQLSSCWRVPGACTRIDIDDGVPRMMNAFDLDNAMLGRITFLGELALLTIDD